MTKNINKSISENIAAVKEKIARYCPTSSAELMLAAKHQPHERLITAYQAGGTLMGHNLIDQLSSATAGLHEANIFPYTTVIGHVQSNKLTTAMRWADRIDTVDSLTLAQRINRRQEQRIADGEATGPYPILLQVNSSGATTQFGCEPETLLDLARAIIELPYVGIDGLMTIGARGNEADVRASFVRTRQLSEQLRSLPGLADAKVLSMGMSGDMRIALEEGSTVVRVGTAIFGER